MATSSIEKLATWRARGTRVSEQIVQQGVMMLENGGLRKMGDEAWSFLEQLALASMDIGRLELADECIELLSEQFPGSPRVECLKGIRIEAENKPKEALEFYENALLEDEANPALWKRQIAVLRSQGSSFILRTVNELTKYVDTFYTDIEGWLELADIYAELNIYDLSLQTLAHVLLLASQNPFHVLRFAETAYTVGDVPLALKTFLRVIDMDDSAGQEGNATKRAWWGVKLAAARLLSFPNSPSESQTSLPSAEYLRLLNELAREQLTGTYFPTSVGGKVHGRDAFVAWLGK
ncbi:hypothetical protein Clacol_008980 [Clathrus columnatus]|uniref:ER membrane protein complex subunit 2 n=1 Tax=Clathrus columnatus TaxID=1419009 RepID=A0AAV5APV3_9AGAM|nr:hypothetical protein Clacol_008980 [Clathrus columnatus]